MIVGGFAAVTHGSSYLTRDVDICALLTPENIARLRTALGNWNPRHQVTPQKLSFLVHPGSGETIQNLYLETDQGDIDILSSVLRVGDFSRLKNAARKLKRTAVCFG